MSEMLRINEAFAISFPKISEGARKHVTEALLPAGGSAALEVTFAAIHEGLTRNNTNYSKEGLTSRILNDQKQPSGLESWTKPYAAPIVKDHEASADNVIGRVAEAVWRDKEGSEAGHVEIKARITDPTAIEKFMRGEYQTGSIGMDVDTATCSICNADFMKGWRSQCEHERGKWYKKEKDASGGPDQWVEGQRTDKGARRMHINIGNTWAREYSVVAVPSDAKSRVKGMEVKEMLFCESEDDNAPLNLLDEAAFTEAVENDPPELPAARSTAELMPYFYMDEKADVLNRFFEVALALSLHGELALTEDNKEIKFTGEELTKVLDHLLVNNEHMEDELNAISQTVLSSSTTENLPDSSFALVKKISEKTIRLFPYRDEKNVANAENLLTSLTWIRSVAGDFTPAEIAVGSKKLIAAARKAKVGEANRPQEIEDAKALLAEEKLIVLTEEEHAALGTHPDDQVQQITELNEKLESLTSDLAEANQVLAERELENTELVEQVSELEEKATTLAKTSIIEKILVLQGTEEDEAEAKRTELLAKDAGYLEGVLTTLEAENPGERYIMQRVPAGGLNLDGDVKDEVTTENTGLTADITIAAALGSPRARRRVEKIVSQIRNPKK